MSLIQKKKKIAIIDYREHQNGIRHEIEQMMQVDYILQFPTLHTLYNIIPIKYVREGQVPNPPDHLIHQPRHNPSLPPPLLIPTLHPPLLLTHR